ncbi:hypothetical protein D3C87_1931000 [compost metagenome]
MGDGVPEARVAHQHVVEHAVIGLSDEWLNAVQLLAVDVRPGVFRALYLGALQRLENLGER